MTTSAPASGAEAPPTAATNPLTGLLDRLAAELEELGRDIAEGRSAVEDARRQQRWVRSALADLERVGDAFTDIRTEVVAAGEAAQQAIAAVQDRIDDLPADVRAELDSGIDRIDEEILGQERAWRAAEQELATLRQTARHAERLVEERVGTVGTALDALKAVAAALRDLVSPLRRQTGRIAAAAQGGQVRRVYVLSVDMTGLGERIEELLDEAAHEKRVATYDSARKALDEARKDHAAAAEAVAEQERTVVSRRGALLKARSGRQAQLDKLIAQTV